MKKTYQSPEALVIKIQIHKSLLLSTSDNTVEDGNGGWVKEQVDDINSTVSDKNIWDDEW